MAKTHQLDVDIMPDSKTLFSKCYVCFKVVSDGWKEGCRLAIGLDGCFLKGIVRGEVIAYVERDVNNHIYPIAWALFFFLMDTRHIVANFTKRFIGQRFTKLFWRAVNASTEHKFRLVMEKIKFVDTQSYDYLIDRDANTWSKAFFQKGRDCDEVENGVIGSINFAIRHPRRKPVITMLEEIKIFIMERIYNQRVEGIEWDLTICPSIRKLVQELKVKHRLWGVTPCGYQKYGVRLNDAAYGVDLIAKTCVCRIWKLIRIPCLHRVATISLQNQRIWKLIRIPCLHRVATISLQNQDAKTYVSQSYSKEAYLI
uniref:SWIM-type domain-containing protein n=1 Tax=Lactuca sativa TaxID=4236 RepID=A0A9R1WXP9_LACSA|nr:hypothetical protein LSAT_V11C800414010 [Lactuca sativa]